MPTETKTRRQARWSREFWEDATPGQRRHWLKVRGIPEKSLANLSGRSWGAVNSCVRAETLRRRSIFVSSKP